MKSLVLFITGVIIFFSAFTLRQKPDKNYFKSEFHPEKISRIEPRLIPFDDTIPNDTIYICFTADEYPYAYFREIFTPVCLDRICLPVWIHLYWSPGGGYLGFSIQDNGILTKQNHFPFTEEDYRRLHELLDDSQSLLNNYPISDLVSDDRKPSKFGTKNNTTIWDFDDTVQVDGISGATNPQIEDYVIKGAAYTTYTLWHIFYGPTNDSIINITSEYLSIPFLGSLMQSSQIEDNYYALNVLNKYDFKITKAFIPKLQEFITGDDYFFREHSIDALVFSGLSDSLIQVSLVNVFKESDYEIKLRILRILHTYTHLSTATVNLLTDHLEDESVPIIQKVFNLLQIRIEPDITIKLRIAGLLENENRFIANMAYDYLSSLGPHENVLSEKIKEYESMVNQNR